MAFNKLKSLRGERQSMESRILSGISDKAEEVQKLIQATRDSDDRIRRKAVEILGHMEDLPPAFEMQTRIALARRILEEDDPQLLESAKQMLDKRFYIRFKTGTRDEGTHAQGEAERFFELVADPRFDPNMLHRVIDGISNAGLEHYAQCAQTTDDIQKTKRSSKLFSLSRRKPAAAPAMPEQPPNPAIEFLNKMLSHGDPEVQSKSALALQRSPDPSSVEPLISALATVDGRNLTYIIATLDVLRDSRAAKPILDIAHAALADAANHINTQDTEQLARIENNEAILLQSAMALRQFADPQALPLLISLVKHPKEGIRVEAVRALRDIGGEQALACVITAAKDESAEVRKVAIKALKILGGDKALSIIIDATKDTDPEVRRFAIEELGYIGSRQSIAALNETLSDTETTVVQAAAYALRKTGIDTHSVAPLIRIATQPDSRGPSEGYGPGTKYEEALQACKTLIEHRVKEALIPLMRSMNEDNLAWYGVSKLIDCLTREDGNDAALLSGMHEFLLGNAKVKSFAADALRVIGDERSLLPLLYAELESKHALKKLDEEVSASSISEKHSVIENKRSRIVDAEHASAWAIDSILARSPNLDSLNDVIAIPHLIKCNSPALNKLFTSKDDMVNAIITHASLDNAAKAEIWNAWNQFAETDPIKVAKWDRRLGSMEDTIPKMLAQGSITNPQAARNLLASREQVRGAAAPSQPEELLRAHYGDSPEAEIKSNQMVRASQDPKTADQQQVVQDDLNAQMESHDKPTTAVAGFARRIAQEEQSAENQIRRV